MNLRTIVIAGLTRNPLKIVVIAGLTRNPLKIVVIAGMTRNPLVSFVIAGMTRNPLNPLKRPRILSPGFPPASGFALSVFRLALQVNDKTLSLSSYTRLPATIRKFAAASVGKR